MSILNLALNNKNNGGVGRAYYKRGLLERGVERGGLNRAVTYFIFCKQCVIIRITGLKLKLVHLTKLAPIQTIP